MIRRFARERRAAVAIEFAVAGTLFLTMLFGMAESAFFYVVKNDLDNAARGAARSLQTNQTRTAVAGDPTTLGTVAFCPQLIVLQCSDVSYTLTIVPLNYYNSLVTAPVPPVGVTAGASGNLMLLKATYNTSLTWPVNVAQIVGTAAYQNE